MAATKIFLIILLLACISSPALSRRHRNTQNNAEAETIDVKNGTTGSSRGDNESGDFTLTGNSALDGGIFSTLGSLATTLFRAIFGGSDDASPRQGGFLSTIGGLLCSLLGGILGSMCAPAPGTDNMDYPVNLTSGQLKQAEDFIRSNLSINNVV